MDAYGITFSSFDVWLMGTAVALFCVLLTSIGGRASIRFIGKRKTHAKNISKCIAPFKDAIANIHYGENNPIFIMRNFFRNQKEVIAIFKSQCGHNDIRPLQEAWDKYEQYYTEVAKDAIYLQFASVPEPFKTTEYEILDKYLHDIIKVVKKT